MSRRRSCLDGGSALLLKGSPPTSPPLPGPFALVWQNRFASTEEENKNIFLENEYVSFAPSKNPGQQFWQIILRLLSQYAWTHLKFFSKLPRIWRLWDCVSNLRPILNNHIIRDLVLFLLFHPFPGFKFVFLSLTTFKLMCIGSPLPAMNLAGNCWQSWKGCLCHFDDRPAMCVHTAQLWARMCAHLKSSFLQVYWAPVLLSVQMTGLAKRWRVGWACDCPFVIIAIHRMESLSQSLLVTYKKLLWQLALVSQLRIAASK